MIETKNEIPLLTKLAVGLGAGLFGAMGAYLSLKGEDKRRVDRMKKLTEEVTFYVGELRKMADGHCVVANIAGGSRGDGAAAVAHSTAACLLGDVATLMETALAREKAADDEITAKNKADEEKFVQRCEEEAYEEDAERRGAPASAPPP